MNISLLYNTKYLKKRYHAFEAFMGFAFRRDPAEVLPIAMSLAALVVVSFALVFTGAGRESDEGTAAHLFQLLIGGQLPVIGYFVLTRLRHSPGYVLRVLALQLVAALPVLGLVYFCT